MTDDEQDPAVLTALQAPRLPLYMTERFRNAVAALGGQPHYLTQTAILSRLIEAETRRLEVEHNEGRIFAPAPGAKLSAEQIEDGMRGDA